MKFWLSLLMGFLIITNFMAINYLDYTVERWFRFGATFIFFVIYLLRYFSGVRLLIIFLLLVICDGLLVYYEVPVFNKIIYLVRILAYINLILLIKPSLSRLKANLFTITISVLIIALDIYLLHEMAQALYASDQDTFSIILFYLLGIASLAIVATSLSYLNRYASKKSFFLVILSFAFILSDLFFYNAYYLDFGEFYFLDRFMNILGMGFLLAFSFYHKRNISEPEIS